MKQRRTLDGIITRAVVIQTILVIAVIAVAVVAVVLEGSVASSERRLQGTLVDLESFEFQVLNAETGFRGYALTEKAPFLGPYRQAIPALATLRPKLLGEVSGADRKLMAQAYGVQQDWQHNFAEPALANIRAGHGAVARQAISEGKGKLRVDNIRRLVDAIRVNIRDKLRNEHDHREQIDIALVPILLLAIAAGVAGGWRAATVLRRAVVRPMIGLVDATRRIRSGDLSARAPVRGAAEVAQVAESLNAMAGEVEQVVEGLREVDLMKTRFVSTVSHELRTPLTSITGYLTLLEQSIAGELNQEQLNFVHVAQRNGDRLAGLIDDLLTLSRLDAGRLDLKREPVDLAVQLRQLCEEMAPVADERDSQLGLDAPDELVVRGDARRLQQSFANLVSNAIKFNRSGGEVRISAAEQNGNAVVEVSDQGVGIPPTELERVGERFFRASTTTNLPGTGLGLAITREIVERHGGRLEIESEVGTGSTFRITLPCY